MTFRRKLLIGSIPLLAALLTWATTLNCARVSSALENERRAVLNQQWAAMKGYLRLERNQENGKIEELWYYDTRDPDESAEANRIREASLVADQNGQALSRAGYREVGVDPSSQIRNRVKEALGSPAGRAFFAVQNVQGSPHLVRYGVVLDEERHSSYYAETTVPLSQDHSVRLGFIWNLVGVIVCALLLGWTLGRLVPQQQNLP